MYKSYIIANHFIKASQDTGYELTPMKLIKLTYIAHGWHLGLYNESLLPEVIYAWKYGPVIKNLYHEFKKYGNNQITELYKDEDCEECYPFPDEEIKPFLDEIWDVYKEYDGIQLSTMTHKKGTPWYKVWHEEGRKNTEYAIIPNQYIKEYYQEKKVNPNDASA